MTNTTHQTPMMQQYAEIKKQHEKSILFFRMGDFYEMFFDDAIVASKILDIALTQRGDKVPMCGIPYHAAKNYIPKLLEANQVVAICEQLENPQEAKGRIVKRDVIRTLTPGSLFEEDLLDDHIQVRMGAISPLDNNQYHMVMLDLSTGEVFIECAQKEELTSQISHYNIKEVICLKNESVNLPHVSVHYRFYNDSLLEEKLQTTYNTMNIATLELSRSEELALFYILSYVDEIAPYAKIHWQTPQKKYLKEYMLLDESTIKTLELIEDHSGNHKFSLYGVLNCTKSSIGARKLKENLLAPSLNKNDILAKQECIDFFLKNYSIHSKIQEALQHVFNISRILQHLQNSPQVRHLGNLKHTLENLFYILDTLNEQPLPTYLYESLQQEDLPHNLLKLLEEALLDEALPPLLDERRFVKPGFSKELDDLFEINHSAYKIINNYEKKEKQHIPNIRIRYNKILGYHIEISKGNANKAPSHYIRRQTLTNVERFTTEDLQKIETKILNAKETIITEQSKIFTSLIQNVLKEVNILQYWCNWLAEIDFFCALSEVAYKHNYVLPQIGDDGELELQESRHPVIEVLFKNEVFVPNDVLMNQTNRHLGILTGPNMSGKSTYIRQIGLIQIMAQIGSFVPCTKAKVSLVDRIFTRIGAFDRLFQGESTFFVEMLECAKILQNYSQHSLLLLDEVGRGTSTYDGVSIARAMIEFLNENSKGRPKTLFATHFAELGKMIQNNKGIFGLTMLIEEENDKIVFLRKVIEGITDKSYGIYVAELAGLPENVIQQAKKYLQELEEKGFWVEEKNHIIPSSSKTTKIHSDQNQLSMFS